jgi:hypothetical protein
MSGFDKMKESFIKNKNPVGFSIENKAVICMTLTLFVLYSAYKVALVFFWPYYRSSLYPGGI